MTEETLNAVHVILSKIEAKALSRFCVMHKSHITDFQKKKLMISLRALSIGLRQEYDDPRTQRRRWLRYITMMSSVFVATPSAPMREVVTMRRLFSTRQLHRATVNDRNTTIHAHGDEDDGSHAGTSQFGVVSSSPWLHWGDAHENLSEHRHHFSSTSRFHR